MDEDEKDIWPPELYRAEPCHHCGYTGIPLDATVCPNCGSALRQKREQPIDDVWRGTLLMVGCAGVFVAAIGGVLTCSAGVAGGLAPGERNIYAPFFLFGLGIIVFAIILAIVVARRR